MEKKQANKFYPYFKEDEKPTVDKLVGFFNKSIFKQQDLLTDFLNPREIKILKTIAGNDTVIQSFGGYSAAEKKRIYLSQESVRLIPDDYKIELFQIKYPIKFVKLTHSSILGTLANSGISTNTFW